MPPENLAFQRYDRISQILHWLVAVQIITQFALALIWKWAGKHLAHQLIKLHISLGVCLAMTLALRIVWRLFCGKRLPEALSSTEAKIAHSAHLVLYAMMVGEVAIGFAKKWVRGQAVSMFGLLQIPAPLPIAPALQPWLDTVHNYLGWAIIIVAFGHAAAAIFHRLALRDGILQRMTG